MTDYVIRLGTIQAEVSPEVISPYSGLTAGISESARLLSRGLSVTSAELEAYALQVLDIAADYVEAQSY